MFGTCTRAKSLQSCLTLRDPIDCSSPGSSVHGILQARILVQLLSGESNQLELKNLGQNLQVVYITFCELFNFLESFINSYLSRLW